jgi:uncharacterized protein
VLRFALAALPAQPWKNGGGTTREIAARPPGAGTSGFTWRVSVAEIARPGPFSAFPGVDRHIMLLAGRGVRLRGAAIDHRLDRALEPFAFAGEEAIDAELLGGPSLDLNVMTRRGAVRAAINVARGPALVGACEGLVLFAARGAFRVLPLATAEGVAVSSVPPFATAEGVAASSVPPFALSEGEGAVFHEGAVGLAVEAATPNGALVVIRLMNE